MVTIVQTASNAVEPPRGVRIFHVSRPRAGVKPLHSTQREFQCRPQSPFEMRRVNPGALMTVWHDSTITDGVWTCRHCGWKVKAGL